MSIVDQQLEEFFSRFERANQSSDIAAFGELYGERFMFGSPNGVQTVERDAFMKVIPKMKAHFSSMGLFERSVHTVDAHALSPKYLLATVTWKMGVQTFSGKTHIDVLASYVLMRGSDGALSIVFQIDHQDLETVIKNQQEVP
jgi:ketosteroid isomerase-like protein